MIDATSRDIERLRVLIATTQQQIELARAQAVVVMTRLRELSDQEASTFNAGVGTER